MSSFIRRRWLLLLLTTFPLGCSQNPPLAPNKAILGTWQAVSGEAFGKQTTGKEAWGMRITFAEGKAIWDFNTKKGWQSFDGLCRIDPGGKSGCIDLGQPKSEDPLRVALGIYKINGDSLQINMGKDRPSDFDQPTLTKLKFKRVR